jgi:hypothetical protein
MIRKTTRILYAAALVGGTMLSATAASAQATRTWVSGVGDDVNPCSRTAPCKTFAGAISKTAAGGEINCLDPGGFGAVTINKSLTIDCHYTEGGTLAAGNGIVVNAAATDVIVLRGLDIFGVNPPTHGVRILVAGAVIIEDCTIRRFNSASSFGISFQPSGSTNLYVSNTTISSNGNGATGGGINIQPTGTGSAHVVLQDVRVQHNANFGVSVDTTGNSGVGVAVMLNRVQIAGNTGNGLNANSPGPAVIVQVRDSAIAYNNASGISANGGNARVRVGNTTIFGNGLTSGAGVSIAGGAIVNTYNDNNLDGNAADGAFTSPAIIKH